MRGRLLLNPRRAARMDAEKHGIVANQNLTARLDNESTG